MKYYYFLAILAGIIFSFTLLAPIQYVIDFWYGSLIGALVSALFLWYLDTTFGTNYYGDGVNN
jgi:uncharacterized membrane protein YccC